MRRRPLGKLKEAAAAFYEPQPTLAEIRASGFEPEDFANDAVEVWPENWPAYDLFIGLQTQWRTTTSGFLGLDYTVLNRELDDLELPRDERAQMKSDVQTLEYAALPVLNKPHKPAS